MVSSRSNLFFVFAKKRFFHFGMASSTYLYWFAIGLHAIAFVISSLVFLYYIVQYCCHRQVTSGIRMIIKFLTVIGSIACICCAIFNGLNVYVNKDKHDFNEIWFQAENVSHCIIDIMAYSIYIYRLHLSFYDTAFKVSKCMIMFLISLVFIDVINFIIECWVYQNQISWYKLLYVDIIGLFTEGLITILCLWLFNINLFRLMLTMRTSILSFSRYSQISQYSNTDINNNNGGSLNDRQQILINRIVRNALLCSLTIIFWTVERVFWLLFVYQYQAEKYYDGLLMAKCMTGAALMVDACCMLFTFRFATNSYHRFCSYCDRCCENICKSCAKRYQKQWEKRLEFQ